MFKKESNFSRERPKVSFAIKERNYTIRFQDLDESQDEEYSRSPFLKGGKSSSLSGEMVYIPHGYFIREK